MSTPTNTVFGARVRKRWLERGFGLREVARIIHVSPGWLSRLERSYASGISTIHLRGLAGILGVNPDDLMLSAGRVPPDVIRALQRRPELCDAIRHYAEEPR